MRLIVQCGTWSSVSLKRKPNRLWSYPELSEEFAKNRGIDTEIMIDDLVFNIDDRLIQRVISVNPLIL